jgi:hypothetical protein
MADTTTVAKSFVKQEIGSHPDTWGGVLNDNFDLIDRSVGGTVAFAVGGNFTLSTAQAQNLVYEISGALGADATITFPVFRGMAFVRNLTSGGFQLICQMNTGGRSIPVGPGVDRLIVGDGVDFFSNVLAVAKTGDTMSGPLSIITASGTTGLYVSANATVGGLLSANTIAASGGYYANGSLVLAANTPNGGYNILYDNSGAASIYMGGPATDASNIYRQTQHAFQSRTGVSFAEFNASGVGLHGSTIVYDTMTINGGGLALNVPAASASIGGNLTVYQQANINVLNVTAQGNSAQFAGNINVSQTTACYGTGTAVYVPNGNIFTNGVLFVDGTGVIYKNVGPQGFNFRWDGTYAYVRIDNAVEYPIASAGSLGNYLPLSGGTITGNLTVNNAITAGGAGYFGGDVTIHGGGNAALNIDNGGLAVAGDLTVGATGYFGGDVTIHGGGNAALNIDNGGLVVAGNGVFGQALTVNSGGAHITGGVFCDGAVINGGLTVNNPFISCQNIDASNDVAAHGVFRRESVALGGPRGARIECWAGDWDSMSFGVSGGYFQVTPDYSNGFTLQPVGSFSDARLKENIRDTEIDALGALCDLTLRTFEWNEKATELMPWRSGTVPCGLVAQELQATIPYAVSELPSSDMLHVHNDYLVPYLIRAIQQLTERVEELEAA